MRSAMNEVLKDAMKKQYGCGDDYDAVLRMLDQIWELAKQVQREGIFALMDSNLECAGIVDDTNDILITDYCYANLQGIRRLLSAMIMLVYNGTDSQLIEDIGITRYYAANYQGREALMACMIIIGVVGIAMGYTPHILGQTMLAMLPEEVEREYVQTRIFANIKEG